MKEILDPNYLALTGLVTIGMQFFFFAIAYTCRFDKVTDIAGATNFLLLSVLTFFTGGYYHTRQIVVFVFDSVWGIRLGVFLLRRVLLRGKDERFDKIRDDFFAFLGFWVFQMLWVWLVSLPVIFLNAAAVDVDFGTPRDIIGCILWGIGMFFEAVGDHQRDRHNADAKNKGKLLKSGVWSVTRHPNYFGEISLWLGVFLIASSVFDETGNHQSGYVSVLSPVFTYLILMYMSGVRLSEIRYNQRYGKDADYLEYRKRVSPLIPMPQCLYSALPYCIKWIFCEYKWWEQGLNETAPLAGSSSSPQNAVSAATAATAETPAAAEPAAAV